METREIEVYAEMLGSQVRLGTLTLPEDTIDVIEAEGVNLILSPVIRITEGEWSHDAQQPYIHVELMNLNASFEPAVPAQDPPF